MSIPAIANSNTPHKAPSRTHTIQAREGGTITLTYARAQAIKLKCMECMGWEGRPKDCTSPLCPLYPFRGTTMASQRGEAAAGK